MSFFRTNAHWLALSAVAASSVGATYILLQDQLEISERHGRLRPQKITPQKLPPLDLSAPKKALEYLVKPGQWAITYTTDLFVSEPYLLASDGLRRPNEGSIHRHSTLNTAIPNQWFLDNKLLLRKPSVATDDEDNDGFSNEDEWWWGTDPNNLEHFPPLVTRLSFLPQKPADNRIEFVSYEGDPSKPDAESPLRVNLIWLDAPDFRVSCLESVLLDPSKPTQANSYKFRLRRDDIPGSAPVDLKISDLLPGTSIKLVNATSGIDGKPTGVVLKNLDSEKNQMTAVSIGGPSGLLSRDQRQKKFRLRVGELIPGTQIKLVRFEPRREKIEGVSATKDKSVIYLKEEKGDVDRELPAVYNGERGENIANFADEKIIFKQDAPQAREPFNVKRAEPIKLGDGSTFRIESSDSNSAVLVTDSGPNQGKKWRVSDTRSQLLDPDGKELNARPEPPHWMPTPPPAAK